MQYASKFLNHLLVQMALQNTVVHRAQCSYNKFKCNVICPGGAVVDSCLKDN